MREYDHNSEYVAVISIPQNKCINSLCFNCTDKYCLYLLNCTLKFILCNNMYCSSKVDNKFQYDLTDCNVRDWLVVHNVFELTHVCY